MSIFTTKVVAYGLDEDTTVLGIEIPEQFLTDLDLKENEILEWTVDPLAKTASIRKTNIIINPTK